MQQNVFEAYSQNQVGEDASPQKLIEMLYEGLLRFCSRMKVYIKQDDIEQRLYYCKRATAIFIELINSLDYERGGDVAYYLNGLYLYEIKLLSQANLRNDEAKVDEVINVVRCLLEAWREIHPDLQAASGENVGANGALGGANSNLNSATASAGAVNSSSNAGIASANSNLNSALGASDKNSALNSAANANPALNSAALNGGKKESELARVAQ